MSNKNYKDDAVGLDRISVVGLGKLGLPYAAAMASRGFEVVGVDINPQVIKLASCGKAPIYEPGLEAALSKYKKNLEFIQTHASAITNTDITTVLVATPSDANGRFSNKHIELAMRTLSQDLAKSHKPYHLFVISSTLMPGSIEGRLIPLIEKYSKRKLNVGFGVVFVPDFVALGSVIRDFINPDLVLIGESDSRSGKIAEEILRKFIANHAPIVRMSLVEAEVTKVALNCYVTMKISFANSLANLCEKIPGANVDNVTRALGFDKRISPHYLRGGLSFGGTCFPRDTKAYMAFARGLGVQSDIIGSTENVNNFQNHHLFELIKVNLPSKGKTVSILGVSFKPGTPVIEKSVSSYLIPKLLNLGVEITVYDPLALGQVKKIYGNKIRYTSTIKKCITASSVVVVANYYPEYKSVFSENFDRSITLIDCWRMIDHGKLGKSVRYIALGVGQP